MSDLDHTADGPESPVDVALAYRALAKDKNTLKPHESSRYRAAVHTLRYGQGRQRKWIARLLDISPGAVSKLLRAGATSKAQPEGAAS